MRAVFYNAEPRCRWTSLSDLSVSRRSGPSAHSGGLDGAVCANRFRYNAGEPPPAAGLPVRHPEAATGPAHGLTVAASSPPRRHTADTSSIA